MGHRLAPPKLDPEMNPNPETNERTNLGHEDEEITSIEMLLSDGLKRKGEERLRKERLRRRCENQT
ncbi:hypothetical protein TIFTF001_019422 [Ficus carica]|uniref:Uncharacterized protein n=1 Tax=Ficus carica TaxID=3494 RepID=A0AA88DA48_FICCA|nr:hypothetical protein TIFTF001_019422 [Ficus carica]